MQRLAQFVLIVAWMLTLAVPTAADPRWWTDDLQVTFGPAIKSRPHVTSMEGNGGFGIFVAWEEVNSDGDTDILLLATFDGCSWCGPITWAAGPANETRPWVGAGTTHTLEIALQVVFERRGQIWVAGDFSIPFTSNPSLMCSRFNALATPTPRLLSNDALATESHPRIFVAGRWAAFSQFHAVWQSERPGSGPSIYYDHDLNQDGTGWGADVVNLSTLAGESGSNPAVTGDLMSSAQSAATVAYQGPTGVIRMLRSTDAGSTWSSPITVSGTSARLHPTVDSDTTIFSAGSPAWNGFGWQSATSSHQVTFDGARFVAPLVADPDFEATAIDHPVSDATGTAALEASVSVWRGTGGRSGAYLFWGDSAAVAAEIVGHAGLLDATSPTPRDLDTYPFGPVRVAPPDPTFSVTHPMSSCVWDDAWPAMSAGTCNPIVRTGGNGAADVTSRDASGFPLNGFMITFLDDRTGTPQVYFKRTDTSVDTPSFDSAVAATYACSAPGELAATVAFRLLTECPNVVSFSMSEAISRYLIYRGTSLSGPFPQRIEVDNIGLTDPQSAIVPGLAPATGYMLTLIAEDQARNIQPGAFDPRSATNTGFSSAQQLSIMTPPAVCQPMIETTCAIVGESCFDGRPANGAFEPGEEVTIELTFTNIGDLAAEGFAATVSASNASIQTPAIALPTIAASGGIGTVQVQVRIDQAIVCGVATPVDIDLEALRTQWGPLSPDQDELVGCDLATAGAGQPCVPCASCIASGIAPIRPVYGIKSSPARVDATFDWATGADPIAESYNTWRVTGSSNKGDIPIARDGGPWPAVPGCLQATPTSCVDFAAVPGAGGDLNFYQVRGVCGTTEAAE